MTIWIKGKYLYGGKCTTCKKFWINWSWSSKGEPNRNFHDCYQIGNCLIYSGDQLEEDDDKCIRP